MTGQWAHDASKHTRVEFLTSGEKVFYNDIRNFGTLKFVKGPKPLIDKLQSLGPDLLSEECPAGLFIACLRQQNSKLIVQALMDQSVVSGIGNYIKSDSLWLAGISPHRKVSEITDEELQTLNKAVREVMLASFESGGATIRSYKNFDGKEGEYGSKFLVYNRKVDPLGNVIKKEKTKDGRSTFWSPKKQT
jgi:formamidopyrimidine-DNA glycosylase